MNLNITAAGILSFEEDEPMGLMTFGDRKILERRRAERMAADIGVSTEAAVIVPRNDHPAPVAIKPLKAK